jgi:hypothetical protein
MFNYHKLTLSLNVASLMFVVSCSLVDESSKKATTSSHIITPPHYYTTAKAKNLSDRYKQTLERIVVSIVRNPKTARLQFANNIVSTGGIGFFTHSGSKSPDERYLEVVLGVPDVFDESMDFNVKVDRLFSEYGGELLSILCGDSAIYKDFDVAGYGLNLSWRNTARAGTDPRIMLERAVVYFSKESASGFLNRQTSKEAALSGATVFAVQGDGRASRIAFRPPQPGEQVAEKKPAEKPPEESMRVLESQVKERDIPAKEAAIVPARQPGSAKAATPAKSARETITKVPPARSDTQKPVKESASASEKTVEKQPAPAVGPEPAKQNRAAAQSRTDQQVASLPLQPKPQEKAAAGPKRELPRPEIPPQKKEKGGEPQALVSPTDTRPDAEKREKAAVPPKVEPKVAEKDQPLQKTERPSNFKLPPSAEQQVTQRQSTSRQSSQVTATEAAQKAVKAQVDPAPELKSDAKAAPTAGQERKASQQQSITEPGKQPLKNSLEAARAEAKPPTGARIEIKPLPRAEEKAARIERKSPSEQVVPVEPVKKPGRTPIEAEAQQSAEPKREVKAQPVESRKTQEAPVSSAQTKPALEEQTSTREAAREGEERLALAKKTPGLEQGAEGYVIQIMFPQKAEAERWSSLLDKQGYSVALTSVGPEATVRLRVGAFPSWVQAKSHLQQLERQGLKNGVVLQLIQ